MAALKSSFKLFLLLVFSCCVISAFAQDEKKPPNTDKKTENSEDDAVLKTSSELIQTGVAVFDKKGKFVNNLKQDDFELTVDGKPITISFFEPNTVKSAAANNEVKAEKSETKPLESNKGALKILTGRTIFFVVDDLHLSIDSLNRTRKLILNFVDREMSLEDTVAIVSTTGKIGFLQRFTKDKAVLRAAAERLKYTQDWSATNRSFPPINEYEAQMIDRYDQELTDRLAKMLVDQIDPTGKLLTIENARAMIRERARGILAQASEVSKGTYLALEQAIRDSGQMPGRKIAVFISDGFILDAANTDSTYRLRRITDAAARTNTVIYSFSAKGLEPDVIEGTALNYRSQTGARFELQDGLNFLADTTGGRFVRDTNDLQTGLTNSLEEASQFYLLAWEPVSENSKSEKLRKIEVRVKSRPDLKIRVQGGYLDEAAQINVSEQKAQNKNRQEDKNPAPVIPANPTPAIPANEQKSNNAAVAAPPAAQLPTFLTVNYIDVPDEGALLAAAIQINTADMEFTLQGDRAIAEIDLNGIINNAEGKQEGNFKESLGVNFLASKLNEAVRPNFYYDFQRKLKPGLYEIRASVKDVKSGRVGSVSQWIEIADLSSKKLALSSLILSEAESSQDIQKNAIIKTEAFQLPVSVARRFPRSSILRYLVFIYNANQNGKQPDVTVQTRIFRDKELIFTSAINPVPLEEQDPMRLSYAAEIPLSALLPGRYELQITAQDRISKSDAVRRLSFEIK